MTSVRVDVPLPLTPYVTTPLMLTSESCAAGFAAFSSHDFAAEGVINAFTGARSEAVTSVRGVLITFGFIAFVAANSAIDRYAASTFPLPYFETAGPVNSPGTIRGSHALTSVGVAVTGGAEAVLGLAARGPAGALASAEQPDASTAAAAIIVAAR